MNQEIRKIKGITWIIFAIFTHIISLSFLCVSAHAADDVSNATGFNYRIQYPKSQIDTNLGYFKLKLSPNQEEKTTISFNNPSNEKITIDVSINSAKTNQNGVLEYGITTIKNDKSLKYSLKDIMKGPEKIELKAGETKNVDFSIKMPSDNFDGVIAGGIQLQKASQSTSSQDASGTKIINKYAYVIGVVLQETDKDVAPELRLNKVSVGQSNYRNAVFVNFSNIMPSYTNDMTIEVKVMKKGSETVIYEKKQTAMRMAPNSFINYPVSMNGEAMNTGNYVADIVVTSGERNQKWHWTQDFEITKSDADKFNARDVGLVQEKGLNWKLILLIVLIILLLIFLVIFIFRQRKKKEEEKKKNSKNKRRKKIEKNRG